MMNGRKDRSWGVWRTYYDDEPHELGVGALASLARDDVPLLRGADDDLGGVDLLLTELVVPGQLRDCDAVAGQALRGDTDGRTDGGGGCENMTRYVHISNGLSTLVWTGVRQERWLGNDM